VLQNSEWCEPINDTPEAARDAVLTIERTFGWVSFDPVNGFLKKVIY
jgi:hypothetical protein